MGTGAVFRRRGEMMRPLGSEDGLFDQGICTAEPCRQRGTAMRLAIVSDIHGNWEALKQVRSDWSRRNIERIVSLGDNVGYGPDPDLVLRFLDRNGIPSILGNHELGLIEPKILDWFNRVARVSLELTRERLNATDLDHLRRLPTTLSDQGARFVHGCPPDSITTYLFQPSAAVLTRIIQDLPERICFVGHTHTLELVELAAGGLRRAALAADTYRIDRRSRWVINVGSVGQPRDGDNRAKYVIWDTQAETIQVRRVAYDIAATVEKIRRRGWPESNAQRLW